MLAGRYGQLLLLLLPVLKVIFEKDLKGEIHRIAQLIGIKLNTDKKWSDLLLDFLTVRYKIIDVKPRKVLMNPEFKKELLHHPKSKEIRVITDFAKKGENINYFQSKKLTQSNFHDHLQSEWKIHHFHLSLQRTGPRTFVKQGNNLLFAFVDDDHFVVLGTSKHKQGIFGDSKWIKVLHNHFPELIEEFKDDTIMDYWPKLSATERQTMWNKGYTIGMTQIGETVYRNPGVGRSASGHATKVVLSSNNFQRWLGQISNQFEQHNKDICALLNVDPQDAKFKLQISQTLEVIEQTTNQLVLTYPQIFTEKRP